jgi:hypothetical protein
VKFATQKIKKLPPGKDDGMVKNIKLPLGAKIGLRAIMKK